MSCKFLMTAEYAKNRLVYASIIKEIAENNNAGVVSVSASIVAAKIQNNKIGKKKNLFLHSIYYSINDKNDTFVCMPNFKNKLTIGRLDKVDFPEFNLEDLEVKIDSGAYTSSIHCVNIIEANNGAKKHIKFTLLDQNHPQYSGKEFVFKEYDVKIVKSSNGISEKRFLIKTKIILFDTEFPIYLTLTERSNMKFPVLLGRKFLNKKFVIDTSKKELSHVSKYK